MKYLDKASRECNSSMNSLVSAGILKGAAQRTEFDNSSTNSRTFTSSSSFASYADDSSTDGDSVDTRDYHEAGVKSQYDTQGKLAFYKEVMGDGTGNIHFGKWDGVDLEEPGAYGKASESMTDYMFQVATSLRGKRPDQQLDMVDLGSGTGSAARRLALANPSLHCACLNLCETQNAINQEQCESLGLEDRVHVLTASYESPPFSKNSFDILFSQDALIHSYSKKAAYLEAKRIARPGAVFIFSDLMAGQDASKQELDSFASTNMVKDWLTPAQNVVCLQEVGFTSVEYVDMTADIQKSFTGMLFKVDKLLDSTHDGIDKALLETYKKNLAKRIDQCDRKIFSWGIIHCRKPIQVAIYPTLPVTFDPTTPLVEHFKGQANEDTDVIVVDFTTRVNEELIQNLPDQVSMIVTLSSGKDHIACDAAAARGIRVESSDTTCITESVAEYGLTLIISGLRNIFGNIGVRFPGKDWTLCWNCQGVSLDKATIGIIGMGNIAKLLVTKLRALSNKTKILYYDPPQFRNLDYEAEMNLTYCESPLEVAAQDLDIFMPLAPLMPATTGLVNAELIAKLPPKCGLINISRGPVVDQDALMAALEENRLQYAILDATTPEPLPEDHPLTKMPNVFILPHYATNTMEVREKLVAGVETIVSKHYSLE